MTITAEPSRELASMTRMFNAACADLGLISEALALDPNDGGAEPILSAIEELREQHQKALAGKDAELAAVRDAARGTDAQILKERELTAAAISGAMAYGFEGWACPPDEAAWLRPFYERGQEMAAMLAALKSVVHVADRATDEFDAARAAIARAVQP